MRKSNTAKVRIRVKGLVLAVLTVAMLSLPGKAAAGPTTCMAVAAGGGVLAAISLFWPPGIFATGPVILGATQLACVSPTP